MGFKALTTALAKAAIDIVGDLANDVVYTHVSALPQYNPTTDTMAETTVVVTFKAVLTNKAVNEVDQRAPLDGHQRLIIPSAVITFTPSENDRCVINGRTYEVKKIRFIPGDAIYIVSVQAV